MEVAQNVPTTVLEKNTRMFSQNSGVFSACCDKKYEHKIEFRKSFKNIGQLKNSF